MSRVDATLGLNTAPFKAGLNSAKASMQGFAGSVNKGMSAIGVGIGAAGVTMAIRQILDEFGRLQDLSDRFAVSAESLQRIGFVAKQAGSGIEQVAAAMGRANRAGQEAANGNEKLGEIFKRLGINAEQFAGLDQEKQFLRLADAVKGSIDPNQTFADLQLVMGRGVGELIPLLKQGGDAIEEFGKKAAVASDQEVAMLDQQGDMIAAMMDAAKVAGAKMVGGALGFFKGLWRGTMEAFAEADWDTVLEAYLSPWREAEAEVSAKRMDALAADIQAATDKQELLADLEEKQTDKVEKESAKRGKVFEKELAKQTEAWLKAAKKVAEKEAEAAREREERLRERSREMLEKRGENAVRRTLGKLGIEEGDLEARVNALASAMNRPVDSLQSIGLGFAGVNYGANRTNDELRKTREDLVKKLDEVKRAIEEQELLLEPAEF